MFRIFIVLLIQLLLAKLGRCGPQVQVIHYRRFCSFITSFCWSAYPGTKQFVFIYIKSSINAAIKNLRYTVKLMWINKSINMVWFCICEYTDKFYKLICLFHKQSTTSITGWNNDKCHKEWHAYKDRYYFPVSADSFDHRYQTQLFARLNLTKH